jgi:hypothetical protein
LVFKEAPELIYTGLTKTIGKPRDLEKNIEDEAYFNSGINISIPVEDTQEFAKIN